VHCTAGKTQENTMAKIARFEELQSWQKARQAETKRLINGMIGYLRKF
jgi:hypothetical protein